MKTASEILVDIIDAIESRDGEVLKDARREWYMLRHEDWQQCDDLREALLQSQRSQALKAGRP